MSSLPATVAHHWTTPVRASHGLARIRLHDVISGAVARFSLLDLHLFTVQIDKVIGSSAVNCSFRIEL